MAEGERYIRALKGSRRNLGTGLVLLVVAGTAACGGGSPASQVPTGTIGVLGFRSTWQDGSDVESGGLNYPTDIYVVDVARRQVRNLTRDERTEYCWSWLRGGRGIVFASVPSDRMKPGATSIDVVAANGRQRQRLLSSKGALCPTLSPDRRRILFVRQGGRQRGLYLMRIDGTHRKRLTRSSESAFGATWSPDGKQILFVRELPPIPHVTTRSDIYVINADGTGLHRLRRTKRDESQSAWSPDGQNIAFIRTVGPWSLLFTMRRDGRNVTQLTRKGYASSPSWISNARVLFWSGLNERWWTADADGTAAPRPLPPRTRVGESLLNRRGWAYDAGVFSPDGAWVAYSTVGPRLWVAREDGGHRHLVSRWDCCWRLSIAWAPN
jgi:hypothetical protein